MIVRTPWLFFATLSGDYSDVYVAEEGGEPWVCSEAISEIFSVPLRLDREIRLCFAIDEPPARAVAPRKARRFAFSWGDPDGGGDPDYEPPLVWWDEEDPDLDGPGYLFDNLEALLSSATSWPTWEENVREVRAWVVERRSAKR